MATNPFAKFGPRQPVNPFARFGPRQSVQGARLAHQAATLGAEQARDLRPDIPAWQNFGAGIGVAYGTTLHLDHALGIGSTTRKEVAGSKAGHLGDIAGNAVMLAAPIPGARIADGLKLAGMGAEDAAKVAPYVAAALKGGAFNALQPAADATDRALHAVLGGALGAAGEGLAPVLGKLAEAAKPAYSAAKIAAIDLMHRIDVPVRLQNVAEGRFAQMFGNAFTRDVPGAGGSKVERKVLRNFTHAVAGEAGMDAHELTPKALAANADRIGADYDQLFSHTHASLTLEDRHALGQLVQDADDLGSAQAGKAAQRLVGRLEQQLGNHGWDLPGQAWQAFRRDDLKKALNSTDVSVRNMARSLRHIVMGAFERDNGPEDAARFRALNDQFKSQATIEDALRKGGRIGRQGYIDPATLAGAIKPKFGATPGMQALADAGVILFKPTSNSTLAERAIAYGGLGVGGGLGMVLDPVALGTKLATGAGALASAAVVGRVLNSISGDTLANATARGLARAARSAIVQTADKTLPAALAVHAQDQPLMITVRPRNTPAGQADLKRDRRILAANKAFAGG